MSDFIMYFNVFKIKVINKPKFFKVSWYIYMTNKQCEVQAQYICFVMLTLSTPQLNVELQSHQFRYCRYGSHKTFAGTPTNRFGIQSCPARR